MVTHLYQQRALARHILFFVAVMYLLAEPCSIFALDPNKQLTHYIRDQWLSEHGLPESSVLDLAQTPDGYLWLATVMGLVRFDGARFVVFNRSNTPTLISNDISRLHVDSRGALWVGTAGGGVTLFQEDVSKNYSSKDGLLSNAVTGITEDSKGNIWIATEGGIHQLVNDRFKPFSLKDGLPDKVITSIYGSKSGNLWIGTNNGFSLYRNGTFRNFNTADQLSNKAVKSIFEDSRGYVWIGTRGGGLNLMKDGAIRKITKQEGLAGNYVCRTYEDSRKTLWFGTAEGISRIDNEKISNLTPAEGLPAGCTFSFLEDKEGSLWIATASGGLLRLKQPKFDLMTKKDGLSADMASPLFEDSRGRIWLGSEEGLNKLEDGKVTTYSMRDGLRTNYVFSVAEDSEGGIWIGTSERGLHRFDNNDLFTYLTAEGDTTAIFKDSKNQLWIGTWGGGLYLWMNGKFQVFTTEHGLSDNRIGAITEDKVGNLWIGTALGGLNRYKDGKFDFFPMKETVFQSRPIFVDHKGIVWIGTAAGLFRFHNGSFYHYTAGNGLSEGGTYAIVEDDQDRLWIHTLDGLFCIPRQDLNDVAAGKIGVVRRSIFDAADGVYESAAAVIKSKDGKLWFASTKGAVIVDPKNIPFNKIPPPVMVEEVFADEERLELGRGTKSALSFQPGKKKFEFRYTALSFYAPQKVKFRFMLEGLDRKWNDAGTRRVAYYTNLTPGNYRFKVIACNNDGVWNEEGASLAFYLQPHFYQTSWFYLLCAGLVLLAAFSFHRLRVRQVKRQFEAVLVERARIAREIHDSVAQGLTAVSLQIKSAQDLMNSSPEKADDFLRLARETTRAAHDDARRLVQDLRPRPLSQNDLPGALKKIATDATKSLSVKLDFAVSGSPKTLSAVVEDNLLRIGQEAVNNAIKHSGASNIQIRLDYQPRLVALHVLDNGCGFNLLNENTAQATFGLTGMSERARHLGGEFRIQRRPESGTEVVVTVPIN